MTTLGVLSVFLKVNLEVRKTLPNHTIRQCAVSILGAILIVEIMLPTLIVDRRLDCPPPGSGRRCFF